MITTTEEETRLAGADLYRTMGGVGVVALVGELGAGKTCFARGICEAAGIDRAVVTSPTFSLAHEYPGGRTRVCHFDLYRLGSEAELWDIGWQDYLDGEGLLVVEWADRFPEVFPEDTRWVKFEHGEAGERRIELMDSSDSGEEKSP